MKDLVELGRGGAVVLALPRLAGGRPREQVAVQGGDESAALAVRVLGGEHVRHAERESLRGTQPLVGDDVKAAPAVDGEEAVARHVRHRVGPVARGVHHRVRPDRAPVGAQRGDPAARGVPAHIHGKDRRLEQELHAVADCILRVRDSHLERVHDPGAREEKRTTLRRRDDGLDPADLPWREVANRPGNAVASAPQPHDGKEQPQPAGVEEHQRPRAGQLEAELCSKLRVHPVAPGVVPCPLRARFGGEPGVDHPVVPARRVHRHVVLLFYDGDAKVVPGQLPSRGAPDHPRTDHHDVVLPAHQRQV